LPALTASVTNVVVEEGVSQTYDAIAYSKMNSDTTLYVRKTNLNSKPQ